MELFKYDSQPFLDNYFKFENKSFLDPATPGITLNVSRDDKESNICRLNAYYNDFRNKKGDVTSIK